MNRGKAVCEMLRSIRSRIAEKYGLEYTPRECHHEGNCAGTCPMCDAEVADLQRQLDERGITDIDSDELQGLGGELKDLPQMSDFAQLEGEPMLTSGIPVFYHHKRRKKIEKRRLFKECKIAGTSFKDLDDVWKELYVGAKLALVRERDNEYDSKAVAIALDGDYEGDPEDFDFEFALGYVPKTENAEIAALLDMGWQELFECEITGIKGHSRHGEISIAIYFKNKEADWNDDVEDLLYVVELDNEGYERFGSMLDAQGYAQYHWTCCPTWDHDLPIEGDKVVFVHRRDDDAVIYLMHTLPQNTFRTEQTIDDCADYFFTNVKGPVTVNKDMIEFLDSENIPHSQPDYCISAEGSAKLYEIFGKV